MKSLYFKFSFVCLFSVVLHCDAFAQSKTDSLLYELNKTNDPVQKIKLLTQLGDCYRFTNADSSLYYHRQALEGAIKIKSDSLMADTYYHISTIEATRNNYIAAINNADSAFKYFKLTNQIPQLAMPRNVQGGVYMVQGKNELAAQMYFEALKYREDIFAMHNLVMLLNMMKKHNIALEYAFKQYRLAKQLNSDDEIAYACANVSDTYIELDKIDSTKLYVAELNEKAAKTEDPYLKVMAASQTGILFLHENKFYEAINNFIKSLKINNNLIDQQLACNTLINLGKAYQKLNMLNKSDSCFNAAVEISLSIDVKEERKRAYEQLTENARIKGDYKSAYHYSKLFQQLDDSLLNEKNQSALLVLESKYKFEENKKQIALLNAEKEIHKANISKERIIKNIIFASAIVLIIISLLFFNRFRLKKKIESQQALINERNRISADLHDDVGSGLSKISLLSEVMKRETGSRDVLTENEKISETSKELAENISEIIWALNARNDYLENLIAYIRRYTGEYLENTGIHLKINTPESVPHIPLSGEQRRNLFYVVKEALHNIVKHSDAKEVEVNFIIHNNLLSVVVHDNGKGIPHYEVNRFGNGIKNMQSRVQSINGKFTIENKMGTKIYLEIPV